MWFVSPRKDRFSARNDPQLTERAVKSIVFGVDKRFPREHKVEIQVEEPNQIFEFWIDTRRNLLGADHRVFSVDPIFKQVFINMILRRLYLITSGLLSEKGEKEETVTGEGGRIMEFRRAHYRLLRSTPGRIITMSSHSAEKHAKDILKDYGISIPDEIRRRRALGTLKPDEFLTYVSEVVPEILDLLVLPNELKYEPEKIHILE